METKNEKYDELGAMMDWENGDLDEEKTIILFQGLIDSGLAWWLQGCYGRYAQELIDVSKCHQAGAAR